MSAAAAAEAHLKGTGLYLGVAFGLNWLMAFGCFAAGGKPYSISWLVRAVALLFTPTLATLAVEGMFSRSSQAGAFNRPVSSNCSRG